MTCGPAAQDSRRRGARVMQRLASTSACASTTSSGSRQPRGGLVASGLWCRCYGATSHGFLQGWPNSSRARSAALVALGFGDSHTRASVARSRPQRASSASNSRDRSHQPPRRRGSRAWSPTSAVCAASASPTWHGRVAWPSAAMFLSMVGAPASLARSGSRPGPRGDVWLLL
jgi:hypothetical protein